MFNPIVELIILLELSTYEAKAEMKIHTATAKTKVRKYSMKFRVVKVFLLSLLHNSF